MSALARTPTAAVRRVATAATTGTLTLGVVLLVAVVAAAAAGVRPHVELSDSMRPLLRAGDVVWLDEIAAARVGVGDVVAFRRPGGDVVLHRVARRRSAPAGRLTFTTRGDANSGTETWTIRADGTVGRYAGVRVPAVGRAVLRSQGAPLGALSVGSGVVLAVLLLRRVWSS